MGCSLWIEGRGDNLEVKGRWFCRGRAYGRFKEMENRQKVREALRRIYNASTDDEAREIEREHLEQSNNQPKPTDPEQVSNDDGDSSS